MKWLRLAGLIALLGSVGCAYDNPTQPGVRPADPSVPSQVTLGASPGTGTSGGTAIVTARVQNANGAALANVMVTFTTTRGSVSPVQVATSSSGAATATLTASDTADVTAIAGAVSAHTLVIAIPPSGPTPTPTLPLAFLNVSGSATVGVPVTFAVSSSAVGATWIWSFGDGASDQSTAFTITHIYNHAGIYTASVSSTSATAANATITVTDPPPAPTPTPTPTPGSGLTAVLTCTPGTHGSATAKTACNVTLTDGGNSIGGGTVTQVQWDWGDGTTVDNLTTVPVNAHIYANPGSYRVFATVTATPVDVPKTTKTSTAIIVP
jgi:PKD repeat protein